MKTLRFLCTGLVVVMAMACITETASAQTGYGVIEGRAAPVGRRKCIGGILAGSLCNEDSDCPGSTCVDRNVFNITVAVHFNANATELSDIETMITNMSGVLFDVTDGQAEIGQATIFNNAFTGGNDADVRIYDRTSPTWWQAETGGWKTGGSIHVSIDNVESALTSGSAGRILCHEMGHLVFDARDEYESRAAGCGAIVGSADCPDATTQSSLGEDSCLMDRNSSEFCWGQGDPTNLTDISGGNHDATNVTEQSRCRSNRSCWDQVVWSWPRTFLMPTGAPDPGTGGGTVRSTNFINVDDTMRAVLVLDESGSMASESPTRLERLKVAATDFIEMAENDTEVGIVSYSSDADPLNGHANVPIAALGSIRTTWLNAINGLSASGATNIGDGLQRARDMIMTAGGVTSRTAIILMTDGINNEPGTTAQAQVDLDAKLTMLSADGIPVYVTATGSDLGLASQCAEIAAATGGFYVDSADAAQLPETFADFHEKLQNHESILSVKGLLSEIKPPYYFPVEEGAESLTIALTWANSKSYVSMQVIDPMGKQHEVKSMRQGLFLRVRQPAIGDWMVNMDPGGDPRSSFVLRGYVKSRHAQLRATTSKPTYLPGEIMTIFAYPRFSGPISSFEQNITGTVRLPNGEMKQIVLNDKGRAFPGDDIDDDGIFAGIFEKTDQKGVYQFHLSALFFEWHRSSDASKPQPYIRIPIFAREVRFSAAVAEPGDIYTGEDEYADLGDAPDSTNHFSAGMKAYPDGTIARFPTVYNGPQPLGPIHWNPREIAYLGKSISVEREADMDFDEDGVNNIDPRGGDADQDEEDDGPLNLTQLPCSSSHSLFFEVTVVNPEELLWVNIWYDFNRDGDWNDFNIEGIPQWHEWAVRNQPLIGLPPGTHIIESNKFFSDHPKDMDIKSPDPIWMRITLSGTPWRGGRWSGWSMDGGSGPPNGYSLGETEDFFFVPEILCRRTPDLNCDGELNFADLAIMAERWPDLDL